MESIHIVIDTPTQTVVEESVHVIASEIVPSASGGGGGSALTVKDEGTSVDTAVSELNFTGSTVAATQTSSGKVQVAVTALSPANNLSDLASNATTWSNLGFGATVNVKHWGATGDGVTDDTAAIQSAIDNSATGSTIFFPDSTYLISGTIKLKEQRHYLGDMYQGGTVIKQKNSANMTTPMLAAENWYNNTGSSNGVLIENLAIDGNKANNSSSTADGLLLCNWQSAIRNVHVYNTKGSGIVLTDATRNGTAVAGTVIENRIENCRISTVDGRGIYVWEQSGSGKLTDGFCINNLVNGALLEAIYIQRAAGWRITGNHCYTGSGLGQSSIWAKNCFSTRITENYIDNYGQTATTGFYSGIRAEITTTRGSVIANNTISCTEDTAGSTYRHLYVLAASSITTARAVVCGNVINGTSQTNGTGIRIEAGSGTNFSCHVYGNKVDACNTSFTGVATGTLSGRFDLYGSGSPEGSVTAPIGATYTRSDGGSATTLYVKESGTGNTGWTAVGASGVTSVDGNTGAVTASQLLTSIKTVDGAGSGLDADTLDGNDSTAFATAGHNHTGTYQPLDSELTALAGLTSAADSLPYFTGSGTAALTTLSSFMRTLIDDADAATARTTLGAQQGPLTGDVTTSGTTATLAASGVTAATYGDAGNIPVVTVDAKGRITTASTASVNIGQYAYLLTLGHSYTQLGGYNVQTTAWTDALNLSYSAPDQQDNFMRRFAAVCSIPPTSVRQLGKSGAIAGSTSIGLEALATGLFKPQGGAGVVLRHILPNHYRALNTTVPISNAKGNGGIVAIMYGYNDAIGDATGQWNALGRTLYKHGIRTIVSRTMASAVYDDGNSTITPGGSGGSHWSTDSTRTGVTGGSCKISTTDNDTMTIVLPSDLKGPGTIGIVNIANPNWYTTLSSGVDTVTGTPATVSVPVNERTFFPQSGNFIIKIDSEELLVTAGHGTGPGTYTATPAQNSTSRANHANGATVSRPTNGAQVVLSGTASGATGTVSLSGIGMSGQEVPVTTRISYTAADAGKTIILTYSGKKTGETYIFDSWHIEDPDPPLVLLVNQPVHPPQNAFITTTALTNINTDLASVAAEFTNSNVYVVDAAADFDPLFNATLQAAITSNAQTTVHVTPTVAASNLINVGSVLRMANNASGIEQMLVTAITKTSNTDWSLTVTRGYNSTTAATSKSIGEPISDNRWLSNDGTHPSPIGHELLAKSMITKLKTITQTTGMIANAAVGSAPNIYPRLRDGGYITWPWATGTGSKANGTLNVHPIFVPEDCIVTQVLTVVSTAGTSGVAKGRLGVWTDGPGVPGMLIYDSGQFATDATGEVGPSCWFPLARGWYWVGYVTQNSPGTAPTLRTWAAASSAFGYPMHRWSSGVSTIGSGALSAVMGYTITGETGAFANNFFRTPAASQSIADIGNPAAIHLKITVPILDG